MHIAYTSGACVARTWCTHCPGLSRRSVVSRWMPRACRTITTVCRSIYTSPHTSVHMSVYMSKHTSTLDASIQIPVQIACYTLVFSCYTLVFSCYTLVLSCYTLVLSCYTLVFSCYTLVFSCYTWWCYTVGLAPRMHGGVTATHAMPRLRHSHMRARRHSRMCACVLAPAALMHGAAACWRHSK